MKILIIMILISLSLHLNCQEQQIRINKNFKTITDKNLEIIIYGFGLIIGSLTFKIIKENKEGIVEYINIPLKMKIIAKVDPKISKHILELIQRTKPLWKNPPRLSERERIRLHQKYGPNLADWYFVLIIKQNQKIIGGIDRLQLMQCKQYKSYEDLAQCIEILYGITSEYGEYGKYVIKVSESKLSESEYQKYEQQSNKDLKIFKMKLR